MNKTYYLPMFGEGEVRKNNKDITLGRRRVFNNSDTAELHYVLQNRKNLRGSSIKRVVIKDINLENTKLNYITFTGSTFISTKFFDVNINVLHSQNCKFDFVKFVNKELNQYKSCDFSGSFFNQCEFINVKFTASCFLDCIFWNCKFTNCEFKASSFENAVFTNCIFDNVNMVFLNIEYATIKECKISNSKFSWYQVPYINLFFQNDLSDNNEFYAIKKKYSIEEYFYNLQKPIIYFTSKHQYFPLIQLYLNEGKREYALSALYNGIYEAYMINDIRTIGLYVKAGLLYNLLSSSEISKLIKNLNKMFKNDYSALDDYNLLLYSKVKQQLQSPDVLPHIDLAIQTGFKETELDKVGELCTEIDKLVVENNCQGTYKITHNSDPMLWITIVGVTFAGLQFVYTLIKDFLERKKSAQNQNNVNQGTTNITQNQIINNYTIININSVLNDYDDNSK